LRINKIIIFAVILLLCLACNSISHAKYVIEYNEVVAHINIDNTKPVGEVEYSTKEITNKEVEATIKLSEPIEEVEGWEYIKENNILKKTYKENASESIVIKDLAGNENQINVDVLNIDKTLPKIELSKINNANTLDPKVGNKLHEIVLSIKILDDNIQKQVDLKKIDVFVGDVKSNCGKLLKNIKLQEKQLTFDLKLTDIEEEGELKIMFNDNTCKDKAGNENKKTEINTDIKINNTPVIYTYATYTKEKGWQYEIKDNQISLADFSEFSVIYQIYDKNKGWLNPAVNGEKIENFKSGEVLKMRMAITPNKDVEKIMNIWQNENEDE